MTLLRAWLAGIPRYVWGGWGALASLMLLLAAWDALAQAYGPLVLPDPLETGATLWHAAGAAEPLWTALGISARRALIGLGLAMALGSVLGAAAGLSMTASMMARPWATVLLGTPPIAWLVLAMLWFGTGDGTPVFTVFIACFPIVFFGGLQGARTLDESWRELARVYALPWHMRLTDVYLPHVVSYLFPAWIVALGSAWKVVVMAELLASATGIGAELAASRSQLDMPATLTWIGAVVLALLALQYLVLEPVKREMEGWREARRGGGR